LKRRRRLHGWSLSGATDQPGHWRVSVYWLHVQPTVDLRHHHQPQQQQQQQRSGVASTEVLFRFTNITFHIVKILYFY